MAIPIYMIVVIAVLHFGNVYLQRRVKRLEAENKAKEIMHALLLNPAQGALIKKGGASDEQIDDLIDSIDNLMMLAGATCKIRIED